MYGDFMLILTCAPSEKKWEVFAQFLGSGFAQTRALFIDNQ